MRIAGGELRFGTVAIAFADRLRAELPPARGVVHTWAAIRAAVAASGGSRGPTDMAAALARAQRLTRRRAVIFLLSDFRDDALLGSDAGPTALSGELAAASRHHDLVAAVLHDRREDEIPAVGPVRLTDPERPAGFLVLDSGSPRVRARYAAACALRRRVLERHLRSAGADVLWLPCDRDPLLTLIRFFRERSGRVRVAA